MQKEHWHPYILDAITRLLAISEAQACIRRDVMAMRSDYVRGVYDALSFVNDILMKGGKR